MQVQERRASGGRRSRPHGIEKRRQIRSDHLRHPGIRLRRGNASIHPSI